MWKPRRHTVRTRHRRPRWLEPVQAPFCHSRHFPNGRLWSKGSPFPCSKSHQSVCSARLPLSAPRHVSFPSLLCPPPPSPVSSHLLSCVSRPFLAPASFLEGLTSTDRAAQTSALAGTGRQGRYHERLAEEAAACGRRAEAFTAVGTSSRPSVCPMPASWSQTSPFYQVVWGGSFYSGIVDTI